MYYQTTIKDFSKLLYEPQEQFRILIKYLHSDYHDYNFIFIYSTAYNYKDYKKIGLIMECPKSELYKTNDENEITDMLNSKVEIILEGFANKFIKICNDNQIKSLKILLPDSMIEKTYIKMIERPEIDMYGLNATMYYY